MNAAFVNALASHGASLITHIGLVNGSGVELSGGSYARLPVIWNGAAGVKTPSNHLLFNVPAGATVAGWRGYSALTGGTDYDGKAVTSTPFTNAGTYNLLNSLTNITVDVVA
jgi:hypothetical protein